MHKYESTYRHRWKMKTFEIKKFVTNYIWNPVHKSFYMKSISLQKAEHLLGCADGSWNRKNKIVAHTKVREQKKYYQLFAIIFACCIFCHLHHQKTDGSRPLLQLAVSSDCIPVNFWWGRINTVICHQKVRRSPKSNQRKITSYI